MDDKPYPQELLAALTKLSAEDRAARLELVAKNDPLVRDNVYAALRARGEKINAIGVESAISSASSWGDDTNFFEIPIEPFTKWFKQTLAETVNENDRERRAYFFKYLGYEYFSSYDNTVFSTCLEKGPEWPDDVDFDLMQYSKMLDHGEDPKLVFMLLMNAWGNRTVFYECAAKFGTDILEWSDARSVLYKDFFEQTVSSNKICDEIYIEPAGLAFVEPFGRNGFEFDHEFDAYGSNVADVTVYSVRFKPIDSSQAKALQKKLEQAIRKLSVVEFPFKIPIDSGARNKAYRRPVSPEMVVDYGATSKNVWEGFVSRREKCLLDMAKSRVLELYSEMSFEDEIAVLNKLGIMAYWSQAVHGDNEKSMRRWGPHDYAVDLVKRGLPLPEGMPVGLEKSLNAEQVRIEGIRYTKIDDGCVVLNERLALDDVWDLYKLCRPFIEPSAQIAVAMNSARYAEERGPLQSFANLGTHNFDYGYNGEDDDSVLGNLNNVPDSKKLLHALSHVAKMMGSDAINKETALAQLMQLSDATLKGAMHDPTGLFPTYKALTDGRAGGAIITYSDVAAERTRNMVEAVAIMFGETDKTVPLKERFENAAGLAGEDARIERLTRASLQHYRWSKLYSLKGRYDSNPFDGLSGPDIGTISDVLNGMYQQRTDTEQAAYDTHRANAVVNRAELALWEGSVAPQIDRTYKGTHHVTRSRHSPFARLELPEDLKPFIQEWERRQGRERFQLPDPYTIFSI